MIKQYLNLKIGSDTLKIDKDLPGVFGCHEFEVVALKILKYLEDNDRDLDTNLIYNYDTDKGWKKKFFLKNIDPNLSWLPEFISAGWITHIWFPKGSYVVTQAFINRIVDRYGE